MITIKNDGKEKHQSNEITLSVDHLGSNEHLNFTITSYGETYESAKENLINTIGYFRGALQIELLRLSNDENDT